MKDKKRTPKDLKSDGFSLMKDIKSTRKVPKSWQICEQEFGSDGNIYGRIVKMSRETKKIFDDCERKRKQGKNVWFRYDPLDLFFNFPYSIDVKKDNLGNVTIIVKSDKKWNALNVKNKKIHQKL